MNKSKDVCAVLDTPISELLSDNEGLTLVQTAKLRAIFATVIAKKTLSYEDNLLIDTINTAAILHDIGKCCKIFQEDIQNPSRKQTKTKYLYNEVGWAFLTKHISSSDLILDCIYWGNGIVTNRNKKMGGYNNNNVLDTVSESDMQTMNYFLKEIQPIEYNGIQYKEHVKTDAPLFYSKSDIMGNAKKTFVRACVISANRLVSTLGINYLKEILDKTDIDEAGRHVEHMTKRRFYKDSLSFDNYDAQRLQIQTNIVESCDTTTIVNSPSGFGKTLIGLLWNLLRSNKKIIWVCPRNAVAESAYSIIIKELLSLGLQDKVSVELYYTNKTKKTNHVLPDIEFEEFNSDIIVTNIDNFLNPSINNKNSERLFFINNCDVVFDEYHELVKEEALFAGFVNIMNTRHRFTKSKTLLLSATPLKINGLWDNGIGLNTKILPSNDCHYPAAHKKQYEINTFVLDSIDTFNVKSDTSSVIVFNSIAKSQLIHHQIDSGILVHSDFTSYDKGKIFEKIYNKFDKQSSRSLTKQNVTGTHVIQASLDVSFANLYESVLSALSTLQRIGRCDRWGDYEGSSKINIYKIDDRSENKMKDILYTKSLSDKWFDFINQYNGKKLNLDKLYELYNEFNKTHATEIYKYIINCHDKSLQNFTNIYPKHYSGKLNSDNFRADSNKLRCNGNEIFFICKMDDSDKYSDIITEKNYTYFREYDEGKETLGRIKKAIKSIMVMKDDRFNYKYLMKETKNWDINLFREAAVDSDTPYIRFDVVYHSKFGVIRKSDLSKMSA